MSCHTHELHKLHMLSKQNHVCSCTQPCLQSTNSLLFLSCHSSVGDTVIKHNLNKLVKGFTKHLCSSYLLVSVHHRILKLNCSCYSICQICQALMSSKSLLIKNITCPLISLLQSCHCLLFP